MDKKTDKFEIKKSFGVAVLLKLAKTETTGMQVQENDRKYTFNISKNNLNQVVDNVLRNYNITLAE